MIRDAVSSGYEQHRGKQERHVAGTVLRAVAVATAAVLITAGCRQGDSAQGDLVAEGGIRAMGERIAFTSMRDGPVPEIYVMNPDGSGQVRITETPYSEDAPGSRMPCWSPDGTQIAFASADSGSVYHLFRVSASGGSVEQITNSSEEDVHPSWSPDGRCIAFRRGSWLEGEPGRVLVVDLATHTEQALTPEGMNAQDPAWSPDGKRLAFVRMTGEPDWRGDIWVMEADGSHARALTHNPPLSPWPAGGRSDSDPAWSPDGTHLAFTSSNMADIRRSEIRVMAADGTGDQPLQNERSSVGPVWSPDGTKIACERAVRGDVSDIFVMSADGTGEVRLTYYPEEQREGGNGEPAWWGPRR